MGQLRVVGIDGGVEAVGEEHGAEATHAPMLSCGISPAQVAQPAKGGRLRLARRKREVGTAAHLQPIVGVACLQAGAVLLYIFHVGLVFRNVVLPCLETVARQQLPVLAERPFALRLQFQAVGGLRGAIYGVGEAKQVDVGGIKPPAAGAKGGGEHQSRFVGQR